MAEGRRESEFLRADPFVVGCLSVSDFLFISHGPTHPRSAVLTARITKSPNTAILSGGHR